MPPFFRLIPSTRFKRDFEDAFKRNRALIRQIEPLKIILSHDPYNRSGRYNIKKLRDIPPGQGQYRIRSGKYRLRYDIEDDTVVLYSFKHRKEAY